MVNPKWCFGMVWGFVAWCAMTHICAATQQINDHRSNTAFTAPAQSETATQKRDYRQYQLTHITANAAEVYLRGRLGSNYPHQVFINPESPREVVVFAEATVLQLCDRLVADLDRPPDTPLHKPAPAARERTSTDSDRTNRPANASTPTRWHQVPLQQINLRQVQSATSQLFSNLLTSTPIENGVIYELAITPERQLKFGWLWDQATVNIGGTESLVQQFAKFIKQLDERSSPTSQAEIVPYRNASTVSVQRIVNVWTSTQPPARETNAEGNPSFQDLNDPLPTVTGASTIQDLLGNQDRGQSDQVDEQVRADLLRQLNESVQIETLPDLGIIILRGRDKEVQELSRIIRELERLSAETQPEIQIIPLEHSRSDAVQRILQATSADLISGRTGRVSVTALGKPNALLLIGWGDAVAAVVELIQKLDQPVSPNSQFEVHRLQHALANQLQTSLQSFFQNREGLGTRVQTVADSRTNSIVVFGSPRDLDEVRRFVKQLDVEGFSRKQQARVIRVQNAIASELATTIQNAIRVAQGSAGQPRPLWELQGTDINGQPMLQAGLLEDVQITPNPVNNTLILAGPSEGIDLIEALIRQLDVVGATAQLKVFRIEYGDASTLVQMLRSLMPEQTIDRPSLKMSSDPDEPSLAPLRFSVDTRTNSIIATGSEGDLRIIHALLLRLDEKEFSERRNMVYRLKNAPAIDVANAINNFLRSERLVQQVGLGAVSPFEQLEREVIVVPEPIGNRLILSATPRFFTEIETLITQLDEPPPQVMIQVMIAEITLDSGREFGIELGLQDSVLFDRSLLGNLLTTTQTTQTSTPAGVVTVTEQLIQAASNSPGFDFNNQPLGNSGSNKSLSRSNVVGNQGLSSFAVGRINNELGFGGLVLSASSESVSALLRALQECRRLEILSRPQIRTLDNQPAFIQVGQRVPRIIGSTVNQAGQSNSVVLENVGLILGVTPRISPDGTVVMEVDAERSGLGPESEGVPVSVSPTGEIIRSPRVDTTTAQATVSAASGETIILGGLITKKTATIERKVPGLGDVPLLGRLFRFDSEFVKRTELLIVLTPYVIRDRQDELRMQQMEFARMNWCLCDVEEIHGSLDGAFSPWMFDFESPQTQEFLPGESPVTEPAPIPQLAPTAPPVFQYDERRP
ncbi:MAG: hypothetical protein KF851_10700 [Pirellulaceae bacterium]|nr:hypothetical protein [Pirellulaceae bacterium]